MTTKMNRRRFILSALVSGILLYAGGWWNFKVRKGDISDIVVTLVRKKLDYLQIDEAGLEQFAIDFAGTRAPMFALRLSWMGMFSPLYAHTNVLDSTNAVDVFGEEVAKLFLLSSDFFWNGSDITREVKYIKFYNPYTRPCANPFAILD